MLTIYYMYAINIIADMSYIRDICDICDIHDIRDILDIPRSSIT